MQTSASSRSASNDAKGAGAGERHSSGYLLPAQARPGPRRWKGRAGWGEQDDADERSRACRAVAGNQARALGLAAGLALGACSSGGSDADQRRRPRRPRRRTTTADASGASRPGAPSCSRTVSTPWSPATPRSRPRSSARCVALTPKSKLAHYNLGLIYQKQGDLAKAEASYRRAIAIDPTFAPALYNLGILRTNAGANAEAIALYRRATKADPKLAVAFLNLGLALNQEGKTAAANAALTAHWPSTPPSTAEFPTSG